MSHEIKRFSYLVNSSKNKSAGVTGFAHEFTCLLSSVFLTILSFSLLFAVRNS